MVEYKPGLDRLFHSLADSTRRDILRRVCAEELTISELAAPYEMSLAAIAKHVGVLEAAGLVAKERSGRERVVRIVPDTIRTAGTHLSEYEKLWGARLDALERLLTEKTPRKPSEDAGWPNSKSRSRKTPKT